MQLHFSVQQLQLLADLLCEQKSAEDLLDRVLARDLQFDFEELEQLTQLVKASRNEVIEALGSTRVPELVVSLQQKKTLLDGLLERLSEAAAMV